MNPIKPYLILYFFPEYKVIDSLEEINAIGHRLVHGGEKISESVVIDENVEKVLEEYSDLAPLHNPACILGIKACKEVMPGKPMVGVFDTEIGRAHV